MALFDAYVMVDWSAAATPRQGPHSIWLAVHERDGGRMVERPRINPPTRAAAAELLADLLSDLAARGRTVLVGCDFNFGYPRGFAARLCPERPDWRGVWSGLGSLVRDGADNANDRFALAARLNAQLSGRAGPFWGCPSGAESPTLTATRPTGNGDFPERRLVEGRVPGTHPVWKLYTTGSVGSQTLLGIPRLQALRAHPWLAGQVRVWPFETGLEPLERPPAGGIVLAEVYPSLIPVPDGPVRDAEQVSALARHFARLDEAGRLAGLFAGDPGLSPDERRLVEAEEGWILGVTGPAGAAEQPLRDPGEIYRRSFAIIRREADLTRLDSLEQQVAVRVIHACGMPEIAPDLAFAPGAAAAGRAALAGGRPILTDVTMVAHGIIRSRLPAANPVVCRLDDPAAAGLAAERATTRSAAAVRLWGDALEGAVVAIGNAPTALYELLDLVAEGGPRPAVVLGFPVGFVGAAESKEALISAGLPHICLRGRRGGSAMAAAAVNALAGAGA